MAVIDDLQVYYSCDEASGNLIDAHGSYDLTETSGTIASTTGVQGGCRDFESADTEHFTAASNAVVEFGDEDFTIAFWVQFESLTGTIRDIISKTATSDYSVSLNTSDQLRFSVRDAANTTTGTVTNTAALSTATWYFVVARHDSVGNTIDLSIDDGTPASLPWSGGVLATSTAFSVGARPGLTAVFDGLLDEIGIWRRRLSDSEVTWLHNSSSGRSYADIVAEAGGFVAFPRPRGLRAGMHGLSGGLV